MWFDGAGAASGWVPFEEAARDCLADAEKARLAELERKWPQARLDAHRRSSGWNAAMRVVGYPPELRVEPTPWLPEHEEIFVLRKLGRARLVAELRSGASRSTGRRKRGVQEAMGSAEWVVLDRFGAAPAQGGWSDILVKRSPPAANAACDTDETQAPAGGWEIFRIAAARLLPPEERAELADLRRKWPEGVRAARRRANDADTTAVLGLVRRNPKQAHVISSGKSYGNANARIIFSLGDDECSMADQRIAALRRKAVGLLLPLLQNGTFLASGALSPGAAMTPIPSEEWAFGLNATWDAPGRKGAQWVDVVARRALSASGERGDKLTPPESEVPVDRQPDCPEATKFPTQKATAPKRSQRAVLNALKAYMAEGVASTGKPPKEGDARAAIRGVILPGATHEQFDLAWGDPSVPKRGRGDSK